MVEALVLMSPKGFRTDINTHPQFEIRGMTGSIGFRGGDASKIADVGSPLR